MLCEVVPQPSCQSQVLEIRLYYIQYIYLTLEIESRKGRQLLVLNIISHYFPVLSWYDFEIWREVSDLRVTVYLGPFTYTAALVFHL